MNFRKAILADLPLIVAIYNATIASRMVTADTEEVSVESRLDWFQSFSNDRPIWVLEKQNNILGWMSFKSFYGRPAYQGTIEIAIYIQENFRMHGLGKIFIEQAKKEAAKLKIHTILAFIFEHNINSIRFFVKHGFDKYGILPEIAIMDDKKFSLAIYGLKVNSTSEFE